MGSGLAAQSSHRNWPKAGYKLYLEKITQREGQEEPVIMLCHFFPSPCLQTMILTLTGRDKRSVFPPVSAERAVVCGVIVLPIRPVYTTQPPSYVLLRSWGPVWAADTFIWLIQHRYVSHDSHRNPIPSLCGGSCGGRGGGLGGGADYDQGGSIWITGEQESRVGPISSPWSPPTGNRCLWRRSTALREAFRLVKRRTSLSHWCHRGPADHLHAIWRLPPGDSNYPLRWSLIKRFFSSGSSAARERHRSDRSAKKGLAASLLGTPAFGMKTTCAGISITFADSTR